MALTAANPQPWYLLWALPILACTVGDAKLRRAGIVVLSAMTAWSVLPLGTLVWFGGISVLLGIWISRGRAWQRFGSRPNAPPTLSAISE